MPAQFLAQGSRLSLRDLFHECPKGGRMVMVNGVAEFVEDDVVDEVGGQLHEIEGEVDVTGR